MSFPKYPAYKDSGVVWIGKVPVGWNIKPIKRVAQLHTEKSNNSIFPVALENIQSKTGKFISSDTEFEGEGVSFQKGDILFGKLRPYLAKVWLADKVGEAVGDFHVISPISCNGDFLRWILISDEVISQIDGSTFGAKMPRASWDFISQFSVPLPSVSEQQAIARFLDRECGKIDALIAEQERLIALLAEKRQAVISHAVTKGLNPNAPMKDSGIPWIGMVPEEWEVKCLRYVCDFEQGKAHEPFFDDDGEFICATARFVSTSGSSFKRCNTCLTKAEKRDILMVMSDLPNGRALARAFLVTENNIAINQRICKIVPRIGNECFYYYQLDRNQGLLKYDDKVNQTHLSNNAYKALPLIVPPLDEQNRIASYLQTFDEENVRLNQELLGSLILLKERRAALISAAVTGKIDVRAQSKAIAA